MLHKLHSLLLLSGEARAPTICVPCLRRIGLSHSQGPFVNCEQLITFMCLHKNAFALTFSLQHPLPIHFLLSRSSWIITWITEPQSLIWCCN